MDKTVGFEAIAPKDATERSFDVGDKQQDTRCYIDDVSPECGCRFAENSNTYQKS